MSRTSSRWRLPDGGQDDTGVSRGRHRIKPLRGSCASLRPFAEFESDLIRMRTREGMAVARAKGKLRGKKPKLSPRQAGELRRMYDTGEYSVTATAALDAHLRHLETCSQAERFVNLARSALELDPLPPEYFCRTRP